MAKSSAEQTALRHVEYCTKLLSRYCFHLNSLQEAVAEKWKQLMDDEFDFVCDPDFKKNLELFKVLADTYKKSELMRCLESVYQVWYGGLAVYIHESVDEIPQQIRIMLTDLGSQLASIFVLNAEYERAIICFNDVVLLDKSHGVARLAQMRLVAELGEWEIMSELLKREEKFPTSNAPNHECFIRMYSLMLLICSSKETSPQLFKRIRDETNVYNGRKDLDFAVYDCATLELRIRILASRLPKAELNLIGDPLENRRLELERLYVMLKSRVKSFFQFGQPSEFMKKYSFSSDFIKLVVNTSMLYEGYWNLVNDEIETGMLREAQSHAVQYLAYAVRTCSPSHILRAATLFSKTFAYFEGSANRFENINKIMELLLDLYNEKGVSPSFELTHQYAKLVHSNYGSAESAAFCNTWDSAFSTLKDFNRKMRKRFFHPSKSSWDLTWHQIHPYLDVVCRCVTLGSKCGIGVKVLRRAFQFTDDHKVELRSYRLLLRVLAVQLDHVETVLPIGDTDDVNEITSCFEALNLMANSIKDKLASKKYFCELFGLFESYNHLFLREWRSKICSYLVRHCTDPYERAFCLSEASLCSVRQVMRANAIVDKSVETFLYSNAEEFKKDILNLPADLTIIQLFLDSDDILWLTRLHSAMTPITVPLVSLKNDTVLKKVADLLEANIASTKITESRKFWSARKALDRKLRDIVHYVEANWFGPILPLMLENVQSKFTILNVPAALSCIPFETMPFFEKHPLVCRIFSIKMFCNLIQSTEEVPKPVDCKRSYYILNPGGDLADTEKRMESILESYDFDGTKGTAPSNAEVKRVLNEYDVFLYVGHGSGGRYFSRNTIRNSDCKAVSVLMGCSSVAIHMEGKGFDGRSSVYDYMIARCPCVIGCLWLVTDGDIDKYLVALLNYCFEVKINTKEGYRTFLRGIAEARKACRLPFLTGGSVVAFGLPVVFKINS